MQYYIGQQTNMWPPVDALIKTIKKQSSQVDDGLATYILMNSLKKIWRNSILKGDGLTTNILWASCTTNLVGQ